MSDKSVSKSSAKSLPTDGVVLTHAASVYDLLEPAVMFFRQRAVMNGTAAAAGARDGERILDVGCGTGLLAEAIGRGMGRGEVIGVDASLPMIRIANEKRGGGVCRFEAAVAEDLPYEDESFDVVVSSLFFHHVGMNLKRRAAEEIVRVLKPGGRIAIADLDTPWSWFGKFYGYSGYVLFRQPEILENLEGKLPGVLREAGIVDLAGRGKWLGCVRLWTGRKPK